MNINNKKEALSEVVHNALWNVVIYGVSLFIILFIFNTLQFESVAFVLALVYLLVISLSILQFLILTAPLEIMAIFLHIRSYLAGEEGAWKDKLYLSLGTLVLFVENVVCGLYAFYLFKVIV